MLGFSTGMENVRLTLGFAVFLAALATGCASSGNVGEVREVGPGTYSIGVGSGRLGGISQTSDAVKAAVDKAGEYCHSKGEKLQITGVEPKITFRCVSQGEIPPKNRQSE